MHRCLAVEKQSIMRRADQRARQQEAIALQSASASKEAIDEPTGTVEWHSAITERPAISSLVEPDRWQVSSSTSPNLVISGEAMSLGDALSSIVIDGVGKVLTNTSPDKRRLIVIDGVGKSLANASQADSMTAEATHTSKPHLSEVRDMQVKSSTLLEQEHALAYEIRSFWGSIMHSVLSFCQVSQLEFTDATLVEQGQEITSTTTGPLAMAAATTTVAPDSNKSRFISVPKFALILLVGIVAILGLAWYLRFYRSRTFSAQLVESTSWRSAKARQRNRYYSRSSKAGGSLSDVGQSSDGLR